jgi:hypothetical protein
MKPAWPHDKIIFDEFTDKKWGKPQKAVIHIFPTNNWGNMQWKIKDIDYENKTVFFGEGGFKLNEIMQGEDATGISRKSKYFIENVFEELDSPNEWYYDSGRGLLYYIPDDGVDLKNSVVEVSGLKRLSGIP